MKKITAIGAGLVLTAVLTVSLCGCGNKVTNNGTTTTTTETAAPTAMNTTLAQNGKITDVSESGNNGAAGKAAEKVSEGVSKGATDVSKALSGK